MTDANAIINVGPGASVYAAEYHRFASTFAPGIVDDGHTGHGRDVGIGHGLASCVDYS